jgi:hypothetical protein
MDADGYTRAMFGEHARHVPVWLYVQDAGSGVVSIVGGSRPSGEDLERHPLRYGSERTHQLIVGELIVRPHLVVASDAARGSGLAGLSTGYFHEEFVRHGDIVLDPIGAREQILRVL